MVLKIGDRITYEVETKNGEYLRGKIIAISTNKKDKVNTYLVQLEVGSFVQIKPNNVDRFKVVESELIP